MPSVDLANLSRMENRIVAAGEAVSAILAYVFIIMFSYQ